MTPEQERILREAQTLLDTLNEVVPHTTIHYAVEDARRACRELVETAETKPIHTNDRAS